ncbi:exonuclease/endonuclease/phosphatase family protein [Methanosalsum zhilinae]|nr:hypothetical protein [Methanosalsum zhilinae]
MAYPFYKSYHKDAWDYLLNEIDADIILFQEARPTAYLNEDDKHLVWNEIGDNRSWGSGIYSQKYELKEETIKSDFKGVFSIANTTIGVIDLTLISIYGLIENNGPNKGFAITNLHRILSDLTGLFCGRINGKRNIILGGDLNASLQIDQKQKGESHKIFFERLEDFGLKDAFKKLNKPYPLQTLRHSKSKVKWQNDYFFLSEQISNRIVDCAVIENESIRRYSDHNPVVMTIEL